MLSLANPESAVRRYFTFLSDPSQLLDVREVAKFQKKVDAAKDLFNSSSHRGAGNWLRPLT